MRAVPDRSFLPPEIQDYANRMGKKDPVNSYELNSLCDDAPEGVELKFDSTEQPLLMYKDWIIVSLHEQ